MTDTLKLTIGNRIREIRTNKSLSQEEVAQKLGVHRPTISQIEHGERDVTAQELVKLSELFNVTLEELTEVQKKLSKAENKLNTNDILITFFRHGEALDDIYNQYGGWANPELSPKGINKAFTIAQDLKANQESFDIIYTSPLKRAKQKAEILGSTLKVDVKIVQYLKERNTYGLLNGINKDVAKKKFPELVDDYDNDKFVLGSERYEDLVARLPLIFSYIKRSGFRNVCCVTHGKVLKGIIKEILKMKPDELEDGCMIKIGVDKDKLYYIQSEGISFKK